jgi:hypothetical protein
MLPQQLLAVALLVQLAGSSKEGIALPCAA